MRLRQFAFLMLLPGALGVLLALAPSARAQAGLRRLTAGHDTMNFVWAPQGDALYVTRAGKILSPDATRLQVTGDLFRVATANGASELLAENANGTQTPLIGDEIAFTRLAENGTARAIVYNPVAGQELDVGEITWGAPVQWNREGGALFFLQDGKLRRATTSERSAAFGTHIFPTNTLVSPLGDRAASLDPAGLEVTQGDRRETIARNSDVSAILPQFVWSHSGTLLAYLVTQNGFDPEVWVADTARHTTQRVAQGQGLEYVANVAWSPDDVFLIFTRTPAGSSVVNQSEIWRVGVNGSGLRTLTHNRAEETAPQYSPDGKSIAFLRDGDVWVMELNAKGLPRDDAGTQELAQDFRTPRAVSTQRVAPATIRVRHDAANACRSVPVGQIDVLDFETYVKRVVPAEVFPTWDEDALKTQAVAARTYAWFWILQHTTSTFDVTDSTAYQYFCDNQYASTDNATEATRGQYLDYQGYMVFAAYGSENGDPTLTNTFSNPYLLGVDDPVGFMKTRAGNGIGYSQWGAQRWASGYGWSYQQILRHYYSNVTVEAAAGDGNDVTPPIGAIVAPWNGWGITSNRIALVVNASDDASGIATIDLNAEYNLGGIQNVTLVTLSGSQREFVWDVSALPNQTHITVTPVIHDGIGNTATGAGVILDLDRIAPQGTLTAPATTTNQTVSLALDASDTGSSGLAGMMFSNDWEWQGENQNVQANSGSVVADSDALNGSALRGLVGTNPAGAWYGPYTNVLPVNQPYRAYFRIKADNVTLTDEIARLDVVTDSGTNILGLKQVHGTDLRAANVYQEFYVDFDYSGYSTNAPEFRVAYRATASLWLDRILVVRYPAAYATTAEWKLSDGEGNKRVIAKFPDGAGNVSVDAISTLFYGENPPPTLLPRSWLPFLIRQW